MAQESVCNPLRRFFAGPVLRLVLIPLMWVWFGWPGQPEMLKVDQHEDADGHLSRAASKAQFAAMDAEPRFTYESSLASTASLTITGETGYYYFGARLTNAGDINGDGFGDMITGAQGYFPLSGRLYVLYGRPSGRSAKPDLAISGPAPSTNAFGVYLAAGDLNGDGFDDVVVGEPSADGGWGRVYYYPGSAIGLGLSPALTIASRAGGYFGGSVVGLGDTNGDHFDDLAIGAYPGGGDGQVYVFPGTPTGPADTPVFTLTGSAGRRIGEQMVGDGDINGDGYADWVLREKGAGNIVIRLGGPAGLKPVASMTLTLAASPHGGSLGPMGDINGDGFDDLGIPDPFYMNDTGAVFVYMGGPDGMTANPVITLVGGAPESGFGLGLTLSGDVNRDGFSDLAVGRRFYSGPDPGNVFVYPGGAGGLAQTPVLTLTGNEDGSIGDAVLMIRNGLNTGCHDLYVGSPYSSSYAGQAVEYACSEHRNTFIPRVLR